MPVNIAAAIDAEINNLEKQLSALRMARQALGASRPSAAAGTRKRRKLTAAEKTAISRRMKAAWKRRKAAAKG
jgi:hypothetical protein